MKQGFCMMAFAKGQTSNDNVVAPKYIGIAPVFILAVNPNKAQLEKIYGRALEDEPKYIMDSKADANGKIYPSVRINFIVKTDPDKSNGIEMTTGVTFFLQKKYIQGSQSGKYKIMDKYGRTAWATKEDIEAKRIPEYKNGPANIDKDYRPLYSGEEELTNFIKNYLNIPEVEIWADGKFVPNPKYKPEECEARLSYIDKYFTGDFSELSEILSYQPNNKIKLMFGVRTTEDNKQYQSVYTSYTLKNGSSYYEGFKKSLEEKKAAGLFSTTEFKIDELKEYKIEASSVEAAVKNDDNLPFGADSEEAPW